MYHMLFIHLLVDGQHSGILIKRAERITGTTIKDTWTKSRGRVEVGEGGGFGSCGVEGWGEKAYNCN